MAVFLPEVWLTEQKESERAPRRAQSPCFRSMSQEFPQISHYQIVVDDRERPSGVVAELEKFGGVVVKIEHLTVGDYCIDGAVLIERKTAAHFAQSFNLDSAVNLLP